MFCSMQPKIENMHGARTWPDQVRLQEGELICDRLRGLGAQEALGWHRKCRRRVPKLFLRHLAQNSCLHVLECCTRSGAHGTQRLVDETPVAILPHATGRDYARLTRLGAVPEAAVFVHSLAVVGCSEARSMQLCPESHRASAPT